MKNVFNKALAGLFTLSAIFEVQNSLPPTPECDLVNSLPPCIEAPTKRIANTLPPTWDYTPVKTLANSLPPCIEAPAKRIANTLPPTWDYAPVKVLANSLPPVAEYGKMRGIC